MIVWPTKDSQHHDHIMMMIMMMMTTFRLARASRRACGGRWCAPAPDEHQEAAGARGAGAGAPVLQMENCNCWPYSRVRKILI